MMQNSTREGKLVSFTMCGGGIKQIGEVVIGLKMKADTDTNFGARPGVKKHVPY